jgi:hypothetical protein
MVSPSALLFFAYSGDDSAPILEEGMVGGDADAESAEGNEPIPLGAHS